jgi:hypothetical protein
MDEMKKYPSNRLIAAIKCIVRYRGSAGAWQQQVLAREEMAGQLLLTCTFLGPASHSILSTEEILMRLPSPRTMSKAKQTALIAFVLVIGFAFNLRAFADTYQILFLENTNEGSLYGIDSAGTTVLFLFNSNKCDPNLHNPCYGVYVDGLFSYSTAAPPALNYDDGTPCATPAGFKAIATTVCNNGRVVFGARFSPNGDPDGLYAGPYSDPQFIESAPFPNIPFLDLNSAGDFAFGDGSVEEIFVALDLTTRQTPEPTSFVLLGTGVLGLIGVARCKFLSIS